jgi:hypothetical protein
MSKEERGGRMKSDYSNCHYNAQGLFSCKALEKPIVVKEAFENSNPQSSADFAPTAKELFGKCYVDDKKDRTNQMASMFNMPEPTASADPENIFNYDPKNPVFSNWYLDVIDVTKTSTETSYTFEVKCKSDASTNAYLQEINKLTSTSGSKPRACPPIRMPWCTRSKFQEFWCKDFPVTGVYFVYKMNQNPSNLTEILTNDYLNNTCKLSVYNSQFSSGTKELPVNRVFGASLVKPDVITPGPAPSLTSTLGVWSGAAPPVIKLKKTSGFNVGDKIKLTLKQGTFDCIMDAKGRFQYGFLTPDPDKACATVVPPPPMKDCTASSITHYWCPVDLTTSATILPSKKE